MDTLLLSRFSALGDIAMTIPVVYSACRLNPQVRFVMLTRQFPATLFVNAPENLTVVGVDLDSYKGVRGMWRLARRIKREYSPTTYADLHNVLRTRLLLSMLRLMGVPSAHIRKGRKDKRLLTRPTHKILRQLTPTHTRYARVLNKSGYATDESFRSVFPSPPSPSLYAAATSPRLPQEHWIAIAPFAGHRGKEIDGTMLRTVMETLTGRDGYKLFLFGAGTDERAAIDALTEGLDSDKVVNMAALKLGLPAEMALISECDAMISADSSNMHIASLVGTRVVSVWGATHHFAGFMGWRQHSRDAVRLPLPCRPCSIYGNKPCRLAAEYSCMRLITAEQVIGTLDSCGDCVNLSPCQFVL